LGANRFGPGHPISRLGLFMESPITGHPRALVVDDEPDSTLTLAEVLEMLGCDVYTCHDASECVDHAYRTHPHLILLDIVMPQKSGFVVADELLTARLPPFYLVALSGYGGTQFIGACKFAGFDKHLLKPAGIDELRELVKSARLIASVAR
jgi:two-component system, chemotaxis family, CheB/CheR fusion protein